ncbi:winged helix DNA-binding domain-containing protein [Kitasatospora sp. NPDC058218]|uniref:winged helix DNA-binding domain-containing protein n=1 Tax=Kitasatospora sp. NPDC058218 TaxID=3346385 RepID=UPI0036DF2A89
MAIMTDRALNRATLQRQYLLESSDMAPLQMIEHLVGMQAQAPYPPYTGLWTRLREFTHDELGGLLQDRSAVRILLYRGTIHLVSAADCLALRPVVQRVIDRMYVPARTVAATGDPETIARHGVEILKKEPLTPKELGDALTERFPNAVPRQLGDVARAKLALVQTPPRAVWGIGGVTRYATAESWLGAPLKAASLPSVIRRYLAAFGPATVQDVQAWCGLTRLREVTDSMGDLLRLRGERGAELLDLPDAPRPGADVPAPVRFLPDFDNVVLSYADRSRIVPEQHRGHLFLKNGIVPGSVLVDGMVAGTWRADAGVVTITLLERIGAADEVALLVTGERLARFLAPSNADVDVRFAK